MIFQFDLVRQYRRGNSRVLERGADHGVVQSHLDLTNVLRYMELYTIALRIL